MGKLYKGLVRPVIFRFSPERAHRLALSVLKREPLLRPLSRYFNLQDKRLEVELCGLKLPNPVGVADGFDKNGDAALGLMHLGFGYVVVGTVLLHPRPGNPHPIYLRLEESLSLMNCAGLPSKGLDYAAKRLEACQKRRAPVIAHIQGFSLEEYLQCFHKLEPLADAIEISRGCPNVYSSDARIELREISDLLSHISKTKTKPFFLKLPPPLYPGYEENYHAKLDELLAICQQFHVDGLVVSGARCRVPEPRLSMKAGTLSGKAIFADTLQNIRQLFLATDGTVPIRASGGIFTGQDAFEAMAAGATCVELLTGLVYEGWSIARQINLELLELMERHRLKSIRDLVGIRASP